MSRTDEGPSSGVSFKGFAVVSCGTLRGELNYLREQGFLDADAVLFTAPGLHENQHELEKQLTNQLEKAKSTSSKLIVVYGGRCFLDPLDPARDIDRLIAEKGPGITRVAAKSCVDMLADEEERNRIAGGRSIYWLTPGWVNYWKAIFRNWDEGLANETFPKHDAAIVLDVLGDFEETSSEAPEKILEFSDWMKLGIECREISIERLKNLLAERVLRPVQPFQ